jgi:uncharacterized LabA/DUF88 family protein
LVEFGPDRQASAYAIIDILLLPSKKDRFKIVLAQEGYAEELMSIDKAAIFIDNSNVFKGTQSFSHYLYRKGDLKRGQYLRVNWERVISMLESQQDGLDIFARHFFASLPPAADVSRLKKLPTEEEWNKLVRDSAQSGFYKVIQNPPFNFTLHAVPLRFAQLMCRRRMRSAYYKCAPDGKIDCKLSLDLDECYNCPKKFLFKFEKGVDVALAAELVIFGAVKSSELNRIILVSGDGDYLEAIRFLRREIGKDIQIVSWSRALSSDLAKLGNKPVIRLDDYWETICEVRGEPPLDESPAVEEEAVEEGDS